MPFGSCVLALPYILAQQRFELLEQMRADDDGMGQMHPTYVNPWPQLWRKYMDDREFHDARLWNAQYQQRPAPQ